MAGVKGRSGPPGNQNNFKHGLSDLRAAAWLGGTYTLHGELMVVGGLMFGLWALRAWWR